jgi:hypothetical protein
MDATIPRFLETDPMQPSALRNVYFQRPTIALALAALLFGAACSGGDEGQAPKNPAQTKTEQATPAQPAPPPAPAKAEEPAPAMADAVPAAPAGETPNMPPPAVDEHAGHNHAPGEGHDQVTDASAAAMSTSAREAKESLAKAEATAAQKIGDPLEGGTDPNSKAKLTYEFGTESKNFGKCMQGDVLTHTFALQSSGEEDLVIKQAKPTCGCTLAQVAIQQADGAMAPYNFGSPIPPGRKIELTATLHTQNKRGHAASRINIFSNDPRGQSQLALEADVDPFFQVNPMNLNFNTVSARDTANDRVSIATTRSDVKVKLTAPTENIPQGVSFEVAPIEPDAEGKSARWELIAHIGPNLVEGNLAYTIPLKSDIEIPGGEKLPSGSAPTYEISIPIMARVTGMISYTPAFVSLGLIRPGQVVSRSVRITSHDPEFKIPEPKVTVTGRGGTEWEFANRFSSVIRPVAGENAIDVELRLDGMPDTLNGSFSGELSIQVGHPEKPEIKLPITGVCRGAPATSQGPEGGAETPPK